VISPDVAHEDGGAETGSTTSAEPMQAEPSQDGADLSWVEVEFIRSEDPPHTRSVDEITR
jgi:hypothetical protein